MPSIRSSRVALPDGVRPATIEFGDGTIFGVSDAPADLDFGDLVVLPGLVDSHVHVNEPGRTHWEGFATATRAALAGGTTTIVDMPLNSIPPTVDVPSLVAKREAASGQCVADVAFWGGIVPGSEAAIPGLIEAGVCGFKGFLVDSGVDEYPSVTVADLATVVDRLGAVPLLVHAEHPAELLAASGDPTAYSTYLASRPGMAEARAIDDLAALADRTGASIHVLHVSGAAAVDALRRHAASGLTAETCPHYLTFDAAGIPPGATEFKCAPPIRGREDREALWEGLGDGTMAMVVSDHSPAPPELKGGGDFLAAWGGIASLELRLFAVWREAAKRGYDLNDVARWLAHEPARLAGLDDRKGSLAVGKDADLVVFDPDGEFVVDSRHLAQRHPVTPYDGMRLRGEVVSTYLHGRLMTPAQAPRGRLLKRGMVG